MEIQRSILLFFVEKANAVFDLLAQFFTLFGEGVISVALMLFIFLCLNKKKGFAIMFSFLFANSVMNVTKAIIRFPRPWVVYPEIECKRFSTATGYSFPSGHTTCASSVFGSVSVMYRRRWISIVSAVIILLTGVSRCYLCCHWPLDVFCGWLIGLFFAFFISPVLFRLADNKETLFRYFPWFGGVLAAAGLVVAIMIDKCGLDYRLYKDLAEALGMTGFGMIAYAIEEKKVCFKISESWKKRILSYLISLAGAAFFVAVLKKIVPETGFWGWGRYSLTIVWCCLLFPIIGLKLNLLEKEA